jgi:cell division protein FtsQ
MAELPRRPARLRGILLTVSFVVLVPAAAFGLTYSPLFGAKQIRVEGNIELTQTEVTTLAGIGAGTNVVHLNTDDVAARLQASPWIESASVTRDLPSTIVVRVQERAPVAAVEGGGVVGAGGVVLPGARSDGLPTLRVSRGGSELIEATAVLETMAPVLRARVVAVEIGTGGRIVVRLRGGAAALFGSPGEEAAKAAALRSLIAWATAQDLRLASADVTVPSAPAATLADGSTLRP